MLYLWGNCWSLSLCSPNLFYILLWPLVLSRPLRQLLLKKGKRKAHIDQDLHVYCQDCDLFYCGFFFFCLGPSCFSDSCQKYQENLYKYFHDISVSFHVAYLLMSFLRFPRAGSDIYKLCIVFCKVSLFFEL